MSGLMDYKCPNCGGAIKFDSSSQKVKCPYCDTEFEMESLKAYDEELKNEQHDKMNWDINEGNEWKEDEAEKMSVYVCNSCGGEIVGDENMTATTCPFCDNAVIMAGKLSGTLKPDYLIPFKIDKKAAKEGLRNHLQGKRLLPKIFKDENHIDEVKGIYVPFWLFDADANADIHYKATRVHMWSDPDYNYTKTNHYMLIRSGDIGFERIPVDGSSKIDDDLMESIEPFDFNDAVDFQTAYLAGYFADKYDVNAEESIARANQRVKTSAEDAFYPSGEGFSTVITEKSNIRLENGTAKYALYPVWLLNTTWNGQKYTFAMNGQTGKFIGNLPLDKVAYHKWLWGLTAAAGLLTYVIFWLINLIF